MDETLTGRASVDWPEAYAYVPRAGMTKTTLMQDLVRQYQEQNPGTEVAFVTLNSAASLVDYAEVEARAMLRMAKTKIVDESHLVPRKRNRGGAASDAEQAAMKTIYKYPIENTEHGRRYSVSMPEGAVLRHVGVQDGDVCVWAEVDTDRRHEDRVFVVLITGQEIPSRCVYIGTCQGGPYVWHVHELYRAWR